MPEITDEDLDYYRENFMQDAFAYGLEDFYPGFEEDLRTLAEELGMPFASGRNRTVFRSKCGEWVYKLPHNASGEMDNEYEAHLWEVECEYSPECYLDEVEGVTVLKMEYVTPVSNCKGLPDWVNWVDCQQVGYTREGKLVAFDQGLY